MDLQIIHSKIHTIRGQRVMLDFDLAELYEIENKYLKRAVRRNITRFPDDFMIELSPDEWANLRFHFGTSSWGGARYSPFAFTEHGVAMLSSVLNSEKAIQVNISVIRAFIDLRHFALNYADVSAKLATLERLHEKEFADVHETLKRLGEENQSRIAEIDALDTALDMLLDRFPTIPPPNEPRAPIGFKKMEEL